MYSNKKLGQHFIKDSNIHKKIIRVAGDLKPYSIIEIGPGYGHLSKEIIAASPKHFIAIEKDCGFNDHYAKNFNEHMQCFMFGDALLIDERAIVSPPTKIIANLPYNISSQLLFKWLEYITFFTSITIMLQKEFAQRLAAKPECKSYGRISILFQLLCDIKYEFTVNPACFLPPPKVESAVVNIHPLPQPKFPHSRQCLSDLTRFVFNHRRKQMRNILNRLFPDNNDLTDKILAGANVRHSDRPEDLAVEQYCRMSLIMEQYLAK